MTGGVHIVLVRHGEAVSSAESTERPLTITGRRHAEEMASWLAEAGYRVDGIIHSDRLRARQTAKIFGNRLGVHPSQVRPVPGLAPNDDPDPVAQSLEIDRRSVMVVGHLPQLARLASTLLVGDPHRLQVRFLDAGVVVLGRGGAGWQIEAVAGPDNS